MGPARKPTILISGAHTTLGSALLRRFSEGGLDCVALGEPIGDAPNGFATLDFTGRAIDAALLGAIHSECAVEKVFHIPSISLEASEFAPQFAHVANVNSTISLLDFAREQAKSQGHKIGFVLVSSISVYGLPSMHGRTGTGTVTEDQHNKPLTMFGCNCLYAEQLGRYWARHFNQTGAEPGSGIEFRSVRLPSLLSNSPAENQILEFPGQMFRAAARRQRFMSTISPTTRLSIVTLANALEAISALGWSPAPDVAGRGYNIQSLSASVEELHSAISRQLPMASIEYQLDPSIQRIVDSWPESLDDSLARSAWGFKPTQSLDAVVADFLRTRN